MSLIALIAAVAAAAPLPPPGPPPPGVAGSIGVAPPHAWVETPAGPRWLGRGSFCWSEPAGKRDVRRGLCADGVARGPVLRLDGGETVTFHLGFRPDSVQLFTGGQGRGVRLPARRTTTYRVRAGDTQLSLFVRARRGGDVLYNADVLGPPPDTSIDPHPPAAYVRTLRGTRWMATGAFCWMGACASSARLDIGPRLRFVGSETITFHLGFTPRAVSLRTALGRRVLRPGPVVRHRVRRGDRFLTLSARIAADREVSYGVRAAG